VRQAVAGHLHREGGGLAGADLVAIGRLADEADRGVGGLGDDAVGGSGGGLANDKGIAIVTNTSFTANAASSKGGGVFNFDSQQGGANTSTVTLRNATFSSNAALISGGGIYNDSANDTAAVVTISNTIVDNSDGAGLGGNCAGTITSSGHNLDGGASCALNQPGDLANACLETSEV
jgi:hypothetical protein